MRTREEIEEEVTTKAQSYNSAEARILVVQSAILEVLLDIRDQYTRWNFSAGKGPAVLDIPSTLMEPKPKHEIRRR